jgi:hypothetical protein
MLTDVKVIVFYDHYEGNCSPSWLQSFYRALSFACGVERRSQQRPSLVILRRPFTSELSILSYAMPRQSLVLADGPSRPDVSQT